MRAPTNKEMQPVFWGIGTGLVVATFFFKKTDETKKSITAASLTGIGMLALGLIVGLMDKEIFAKEIETEKSNP